MAFVFAVFLLSFSLLHWLTQMWRREHRTRSASATAEPRLPLPTASLAPDSQHIAVCKPENANTSDILRAC